MREFGRYTLLRRIGAGGMAEIWKAKATGPSGFVKFVALKTILPEMADDATFVSMFIDEAKLVASLVHPNIVQVFDFGEIDGRYFFAMEYVPGSDVRRLLDRLKKEGRSLPPELAIYVTLAAARGLGFAHTRTAPGGAPLNLVHRDVSPQNLLVSSTGEVKVGDFGIAKAAGASTRTTQGYVRGKIAYMSPEQLRAAGPLDGRTDLFSLAATFHEMLTGARLFSGPTTDDVYAQILAFRPEALDLSRVPGELRATLMRALQPERENRIATAAELEVELGEILGVAGLQRAQRELGTLVSELFEKELQEHVADETAQSVRSASGPDEVPTDPVAPGGDVATGANTVKMPGQTVPEAPRVPRAPRATRARLRMGLLASIGAAALLLVIAVLAGGGGSPGAGGAVRGGTLRVALGHDAAATFDLFALPLTRNLFALQQVVEPLFKQSRTGETIPWVVHLPRIEEDGRRIHLTVREGVHFHDHPCFPDGQGRPADGRDLAFSLREAIRVQRTPLPIRGAEAFRRGAAAELEGIRAGDAGVTIEFDAPSPFYVAGIADVKLVPRELAGCEELTRLRQPVGTGPFRFTGPQNPSGSLRLVRAERYWRKDASGEPLPYLEALELQPIGDLGDGLSRVAGGGLDVLAPQRPDWATVFDTSDARVTLAARYQALPDVDAAKYSSRTRVALFGLVASSAPGPLRDPRIRRAIGLAMDRHALIQVSHRPEFVPALRFYDPRMLGYDPALETLSHDAEGAAALLAETGHPGGAGLRPLKIGVVNENRVAELLKKQLAPLGVRIEIVAIPGREIVRSAEAGTVDALLASNEWNMLDGEPTTMALDAQILPPSPAIRDLLNKLASTPERTDRIPVYREIERVLLGELPMIPISASDGTHPVHLYVVHRHVQHFHDPVTGATKSESFDFSETWLDRR